MASRCVLRPPSLFGSQAAVVVSSSPCSSSSAESGSTPRLLVSGTLANSDHVQIRHQKSISPSPSSSSSSCYTSSSSSCRLHQRGRHGDCLRQARFRRTLQSEMGGKRLVSETSRNGYSVWRAKGRKEGNDGANEARESMLWMEGGRFGRGFRRRYTRQKCPFLSSLAMCFAAKKSNKDTWRDADKFQHATRGFLSFLSKPGGLISDAKDKASLLLFPNLLRRLESQIEKVMGVVFSGRDDEQPWQEVLCWRLSQKDAPRLASMHMTFIDFALVLNGLISALKSVPLPTFPPLSSIWASIQSAPPLLQIPPAILIIIFALWGIGPMFQNIQKFVLKRDDRWDESQTKRVVMNYIRPVLLWLNVLIICRGLDSISLSTANTQAVKQRFVEFLRALTTVLAFASVTGSLTQQLQKAWAEGAGEEASKNIGFQFIGHSVSTLVWIAAVCLFMELMGFSTQKWITAGGFGTVVLTLAAREIVTNFLSAIMLHTTRPFKINDWIRTKIDSQEISGVIEHVGWWSPTIVRGDDREAVHIPNHKFSVSVLRNLSQKTHWRVKTKFGISHLDVGKITDIVADMRKIIAKDPQVEQQRLHRRVFFEDVSLENQALMIMVSCFVKTPHYEEFLRVKERLMLDLLRVIKYHNARLATPVRSIQRSFDDERQPTYRGGPMREEVVRRPILLLDGNDSGLESDDEYSSRVDAAAEAAAEAAAVSVAAVVAEDEDISAGGESTLKSSASEVNKSDAVSPKQPSDVAVSTPAKSTPKATEGRSKTENGAVRSSVAPEANVKASKPEAAGKAKSDSAKQGAESAGKTAPNSESAEPNELDKKSRKKPETTETVGPGARSSKSPDTQTPSQSLKLTNAVDPRSQDASEQKPLAAKLGDSSDPWADDTSVKFDTSVTPDTLSSPWPSNHLSDRADPWLSDTSGSTQIPSYPGTLKHQPGGHSAHGTSASDSNKIQPDKAVGHGNRNRLQEETQGASAQKKAEVLSVPAAESGDPLPSFVKTGDLSAGSPRSEDPSHSEKNNTRASKHGSRKGGEASAKGISDTAMPSSSGGSLIGRGDKMKVNRDHHGSDDEVTKSALLASTSTSRKSVSGALSPSLEPKEELLILSVDNPPFKIPLEDSSSIVSSMDTPPVRGAAKDLDAGAGAGPGADAVEREVDNSSWGMFIAGIGSHEDDMGGKDHGNQLDGSHDRLNKHD